HRSMIMKTSLLKVLGLQCYEVWVGRQWEAQVIVEVCSQPEPPLVRPRGLGLGADRITSSLVQKSVTKTGETLELAKGAY
ncbi:hypothetical protein L9F63_027478, partial [Diploptera punctata]